MKPFLRHRSVKHVAPQRGIVLVFALIALVILLIGAVAISRSLSAAQFNVGNIGFKRDLANQSERAVQKAMALVTTGALASQTVREQHALASNYRARTLPTNALGIPTALLDDTEFATVGTASNDIELADQKIKIRYLIERLSTATGPCSASSCVFVNQFVRGGPATEIINATANSSTASGSNPGAFTPQPVYRLTVRVEGPRGTRSFFQSTFTV